MVCLTERFYMGESYEKDLGKQIHDKPFSKWTKKEIVNYLQTHDVPEYFASPIPRRDGYVEIGKAPDKRYSGAWCSEEFMKEAAKPSGDNDIKLNTHYNRVLQQAIKKGIIQLETPKKIKVNIAG